MVMQSSMLTGLQPEFAALWSAYMDRYERQQKSCATAKIKESRVLKEKGYRAMYISSSSSHNQKGFFHLSNSSPPSALPAANFISKSLLYPHHLIISIIVINPLFLFTQHCVDVVPAKPELFIITATTLSSSALV